MNKDRLAVLIGKNGRTKQRIEKLTHTKIEIDSSTGEYSVNPHNTPIKKPNDEKNSIGKDNEKADLVDEYDLSEDEEINNSLLENANFEPSFSVWLAKNIIQAINIGFKPEKALKLLNSEFSLDVIPLEQILNNSEKRIKRMKGRIIGEKGKMRESIEKFSGANLSVYNNLIGIIGDFESLKIARKSISMILEGLPHKVSLNYLQKKYRERKEQEFKETWKPTFD